MMRRIAATIMAGDGPRSATMLRAAAKDVDGGPTPAMTRGLNSAFLT